MNIRYAGYLPTTLLDYPEEVASVIFLPGCNLNCPYCHNPSIVNPEKNSLEDINKIMSSIYGRKHLINGVVISGGEPTLYSDLLNYINIFKSWGLKVKIDTNGTKPNIIKTLNPDYIAMDLKTSLDKYHAIGFKGNSEIIDSLNWIKSCGIDYEIRTTAAPIIFTKDDLIKMLPLLKGVKNYYITNFRNGNTLNPLYNLNEPYSDIELIEFKEICQDAGINCILR